MAAIRSPPTLEVNGRLIEGTNLASSNPTFGCGFATRGRPREGVACVIWVVGDERASRAAWARTAMSCEASASAS